MRDAFRESGVRGGVVITGVGLTTCLGTDAESTWRAVLAGQNGMTPMSDVESPLPAGSVGGQALELPAEYRPDLPREARYLRWTVEQALRSAEIAPHQSYEPERCCAMLGTTLHGLRAGGRFLRSKDPTELTTFLAGTTASLALDDLGVHGGCATTCSACCSSLGAIVMGAALLRTGHADMVVAGGYDAVSEYSWAGFNALRLIAGGPMRPFCRGRQGMKTAEGYGLVILERIDEATQRGATVKAVLAGWGESSDAYHLTKPHPEGDGAFRAMERALAIADIRPRQLGLIAAHATGTPDNDVAEYQALRRLLGESLAHVPVVGFKSHLGHTLGGAGASELILSALALRDQVVPACANVTRGEIEFPSLNVSCGRPCPREIESTLNISLGFGGANTGAVLTRPRNGVKVEAPRPCSTDGPSEVWITGIGVVLPGAIGIAGLLNRAANRSLHELPGTCRTIKDADLADLLPGPRVRRMSPYVKYSIASATLALRDANLADDPAAIDEGSILLGTAHGSPAFCSEYYSQIVREGPLAANPVLFAEGVPNAAAAHLSACLGFKGASQTIIGSRTAGLDALTLAALRIRSGETRLALVGAAEEDHDVIALAYRTFGLHASDGDAARRSDRGGFRAIPGAVAFVVESSESAIARAATPYARIGTHASACMGIRGVVRAVESVLRRVGVPTRVLGSGCGTWIDRAERLGTRRAGVSAPIASACGNDEELFSVTPLIGIAKAVTASIEGNASPAPPRNGTNRLTALCTDWTGATTAVGIERMTGRAGATASPLLDRPRP